jgi:hypothetical protein
MTPLDHDESTLYAALREASVPTERWCSQQLTLAVAAKLGMRTLRLDELLAEWARAGWWEDSQEWFAGFFTDRSPRAIEQVAA